MATRNCGATTKRGTACKFPEDECEHHQGWRARVPREERPNDEAEPGGVATVPARVSRDGRSNTRPGPVVAAPGPLPAPVVGRDLRGTGWWVIEKMAAGAVFEAREGGVVAALLRVLMALGPAPESEEEVLAEVALRGRLAHGLPPQDAAAWERVIRLFEPDAVEEFRRWEAEDERLGLLEGDGDDGGYPLVGVGSTGDEIEVTGAIGDEERA